MMAFFLLLWLLSATTEEQKKGIAEYFTPTIGLVGQMGIGVEGGTSPTVDGTRKSDLTPPGIVFGAPPTGPILKDPDTLKKEEMEDEARLSQLAEQIKKELEQDKEFGQFKENLMIEQTPEGLKIQLVDQDNFSMFERGGAVLAEKAKILLTKISPIIQRMPNRISIAGHTDGAPYGGNNPAYTNWELSADRANSTRRFLLTTKLPPTKIATITGKADTEPLDLKDKLSPSNRRISIILLYRHLYPYEVPAPEELLKPPVGNDKVPNMRIL
jgi:chemotaxis protein MotB